MSFQSQSGGFSGRDITMVIGGDDPVALIAAHPALMKRPVIVDGARMSIGWDAAAQADWL